MGSAAQLEVLAEAGDTLSLEIEGAEEGLQVVTDKPMGRRWFHLWLLAFWKPG